VTNSGSFDSDVKASGATVVHVLWSAVENVVSDGTLMYIGVSVQDEKVQEIQIHVSYEQEDTFNENYQDVELLCQDIQISLGDSGDDSGELTSGTDATAGTTEALVAGSDEWAQTSEENAAKNNAIEVIAYNSLEEEVGEDDIKDAVCKGLAAYGIDELDRIPDGEEDTFYELVRTYLKADADSNHKLIDKLDMELAVSHVKLDQSDKNRIRDYIEQGVPEPEPEQTSIRRYLVLGIALGLLLLVSIPVCIGRIRHGKTKK
jgi:hypothetical protein